MFERLLVVLSEIKARNISKNLLNEVRQIMHSFYQANKNY